MNFIFFLKFTLNIFFRNKVPDSKFFYEITNKIGNI